MYLFDFPNKGDRTLLEFTFQALNRPESRVMLNSIVGTKQSGLTGLANISGKTGIKDAILYFSEGILTEDMSKVLTAVRIAVKNGIKNVDDVFIENKTNEGKRSIYASMIGTFLGDALGISFFESDTISPSQWKYNIISDSPQISYSSKMAVELMSVYESSGKYDVEKSIGTYSKIGVESRLDENLISPVIGQLTSNIKNLKDDPQNKKFKNNFEKLFGKSWNAFFDDSVENGVYSYGGCLGRVVPLAAIPGTDHIIIDTWLTDPYPKAFQAVYFIVSTLRKLFEGERISEIYNSEWNFSEDFEEVYRKKGKKLEGIDDNDIFVISVHYCYLSLRHNMKEVLEICKNSENDKNFHVIFPIIMSIWCARVGLNEAFNDNTIKSNMFKLSYSSTEVSTFLKRKNNYFI